MPKATVLFDLYSWTDGSGASLSAPKGETIDVSSEEVARGVALGGLEAASSSQAPKAEPVAEEAAPEPEPELVSEPEPEPRSAPKQTATRKRRS